MKQGTKIGNLKVYIGVSDDGYVVGTDTGNTARSRIQDTINKVEPRLDVSKAAQSHLTAGFSGVSESWVAR